MITLSPQALEHVRQAVKRDPRYAVHLKNVAVSIPRVEPRATCIHLGPSTGRTVESVAEG